MSQNKKIEDFYNKIANNLQLKDIVVKKIEQNRTNATSEKDFKDKNRKYVLKLAKENGFNFALEELIEKEENWEKENEAKKNLSIEAIEDIAGGISGKQIAGVLIGFTMVTGLGALLSTTTSAGWFDSTKSTSISQTQSAENKKKSAIILQNSSKQQNQNVEESITQENTDKNTDPANFTTQQNEEKFENIKNDIVISEKNEDLQSNEKNEYKIIINNINETTEEKALKEQKRLEEETLKKAKENIEDDFNALSLRAEIDETNEKSIDLSNTINSDYYNQTETDMFALLEIYAEKEDYENFIELNNKFMFEISIKGQNQSDRIAEFFKSINHKFLNHFNEKKAEATIRTYSFILKQLVNNNLPKEETENILQSLQNSLDEYAKICKKNKYFENNEQKYKSIESEKKSLTEKLNNETNALKNLYAEDEKLREEISSELNREDELKKLINNLIQEENNLKQSNLELEKEKEKLENKLIKNNENIRENYQKLEEIKNEFFRNMFAQSQKNELKTILNSFKNTNNELKNKKVNFEKQITKNLEKIKEIESKKKNIEEQIKKIKNTKNELKTNESDQKEKNQIILELQEEINDKSELIWILKDKNEIVNRMQAYLEEKLSENENIKNTQDTFKQENDSQTLVKNNHTTDNKVNEVKQNFKKIFEKNIESLSSNRFSQNFKKVFGNLKEKVKIANEKTSERKEIKNLSQKLTSFVNWGNSIFRK